jgi:hypothetical protein
MRDLEVAKNTLPISIWGVPVRKWAGRLEYSHMGNPRFRIEFVSIWGSTYIPQKTETDIATLMEVMRTQSQHVSENKLTSAARTLSTTLSDWLKLCSPNSVNSVKKKPEITHTFHLLTAINDKTYQKKKKQQ